MVKPTGTTIDSYELLGLGENTNAGTRDTISER